MSFTAAVLTGGGSRRMGRDKALIEVDGAAMVDRVTAAVRLAGADAVFTVGGPARGSGDRHVPDRFPGEGPLGGIITALSAVDDAPVVVVVACDLPWLDVPTIRGLVQGLGAADVAMARTDRDEPLCAVWRVSTCLPVLSAAFDTGERAIHAALDGLVRIEVPADRSALRNVNRPEDLVSGE